MCVCGGPCYRCPCPTSRLSSSASCKASPSCFPISSLGHSVLIPAWLGGSWAKLVTQESSAESPYLAFIVGLHVATALALVVLFWRDWVLIIRGFVTSIWHRRIDNIYERMAWLHRHRHHPRGAPSACCSSTRCARCSPSLLAAANLLDAQRGAAPSG